MLSHGQHALESVPATPTTAPHTTSVDERLKEIFTLCIVMYSAIAAGWCLYMYLRKTASPTFPLDKYRIGLLCISWASMSVGMHVLNKSVMSSLKAPALVSAVQMVIAVLVVGSMSLGHLGRVTTRQLWSWMPVPLFFSAMLCTSCYTYQYISLSLLTVVRNLTPLVVLPIETLVMNADKRPRINTVVLLSLLTMIAGTVVYAGGLSSLSKIGVIFAFSNMLLAVCDRLLQRFLLVGACRELPSTVCTTINNTIGLLPAFVLARATHQFGDVKVPEHAAVWKDPHIIVLLFLSGLIGIGICYLGFECQREISATSFFVMQNITKIAVVVCGVFFFGDPIHSRSAWLGLILSLGGSFVYGRAQMAGPPATAGEAKPLLNKATNKV